MPSYSLIVSIILWQYCLRHAVTARSYHDSTVCVLISLSVHTMTSPSLSKHYSLHLTYTHRLCVRHFDEWGIYNNCFYPSSLLLVSYLEFNRVFSSLVKGFAFRFYSTCFQWPLRWMFLVDDMHIAHVYTIAVILTIPEVKFSLVKTDECGVLSFKNRLISTPKTNVVCVRRCQLICSILIIT